MLVQNSSTRYGPIHYNRIPSVSGRDAGRDPKEARGSSQDSSPKGHVRFSLTFSDAPIGKFARGDTSALSNSQKRGALHFFGSAGCVQCHAVSGESNEQFSDFRQHVIGLPQLFPSRGNVLLRVTKLLLTGNIDFPI